MLKFVSILKSGLARFSASTKPRRLTILFAAALAIGKVFVLAFPSNINLNVNTDYFTDYEPTAENILNGRGIAGADGQLETRYPPGYPFFLVVAYKVGDVFHLDREKVIVGFNLITGAASSLFVYLTIELLFGASIALLTWFLWTSYIPGLVTMLLPNSEVPFMLFFFAAVWAFCFGAYGGRASARTGVFAGLFLGVAALVRPIAVFLPCVFVAAAFVWTFSSSKPEQRDKKAGLRMAAAIVAGFVLSIAPWELFVRAKVGQFILLSSNGPASISEGLVFGLTPASAGEQLNMSTHLRDLMERANCERGGMRTNSAILRFVWNESVQNPRGVAELAFLKMRRAWYGMYSKSHEWPLIALQLPYLVLGVTGLASLFETRKENAAQAAFLCSLVVYFWAMACLVVPLLRYMVPSMAYVMAFAAVVLEMVCSRLSLEGHSPIRRSWQETP